MPRQLSLLSIEGSGVVLITANGIIGRMEFASSDPSDQSADVYQFLNENQCLKGELVFGIDSRQIYFLDTNFDRATTQNSDAVKFAVESMVPVDAEDMAVLVQGLGDSQRTLVWDMRQYHRLLMLLNEQHGVTFDAFVPTELVWLQHLQRQGAAEEVVVKLGANSSERFAIKGNNLLGWEYAASFQSSFDQCDRVVHDTSADIPNSLEGVESVERASMLAEALRKMQKADGFQFNFAENLDSTMTNCESPWQSFLFVSLILLMGVMGALWFKTGQLRDQKVESQARAAALFRDLFPNRRLKAAVDEQLKTELNNQKKVNQLLSHADTSENVMVNLGRVLTVAQLVTKDKMKFQFDSISLKADSVIISGQLKNFDDFLGLKEDFLQQGFSEGPGSNSGKAGEPFTLTLVNDTSSTDAGSVKSAAKVAGANE